MQKELECKYIIMNIFLQFLIHVFIYFILHKNRGGSLLKWYISLLVRKLEERMPREVQEAKEEVKPYFSPNDPL